MVVDIGEPGSHILRDSLTTASPQVTSRKLSMQKRRIRGMDGSVRGIGSGKRHIRKNHIKFLKPVDGRVLPGHLAGVLGKNGLFCLFFYSN